MVAIAFCCVKKQTWGCGSSKDMSSCASICDSNVLHNQKNQPGSPQPRELCLGAQEVPPFLHNLIHYAIHCHSVCHLMPHIVILISSKSLQPLIHGGHWSEGLFSTVGQLPGGFNMVQPSLSSNRFISPGGHKNENVPFPIAVFDVFVCVFHMTQFSKWTRVMVQKCQHWGCPPVVSQSPKGTCSGSWQICFHICLAKLNLQVATQLLPFQPAQPTHR